jgi:hypothetical protein
MGAILLGLLIIAAAIYRAREEADIQARVRAARLRRGEDPDKQESTLQRPIVSAENLIAAYEENEVAADRQYKDHSIVVTGTVDRIGKDIIDKMYVAMKGGGVWGVQCMFDDAHETQLASVRKGEKVTMIGTVRGKMGNVILRDCDLQ